jgi:hypothetical protein
MRIAHFFSLLRPATDEGTTLHLYSQMFPFVAEDKLRVTFTYLYCKKVA